MRLTNRIVEAGYAVPRIRSIFTEERPVWNAPPLIKMLGVTERICGQVSLKPRSIFAAEVIGPLSGEAEDAPEKTP